MLGKKLVGLTTAVLMGTAAAIVLVALSKADDALYRQAQRRADAASLMLAYALSPALDRGDETQAGEQLQNLARSAEALYAGVRDADGRLLAAWNEGRIPPPRSTLLAEAPMVQYRDGAALRVERRLDAAGGTTRLLQVGFSLSEFEASQRSHRRLAAGGAAAVFGVGALLALAVSSLLLNPLRRMNRVALRLAEGDIGGAESELGARRDKRQDTAELAVSFARMVRSLRETAVTLQDSARLLTHSVSQLAQSSDRQTAVAHRQADALLRTTTSANELRSVSVSVGERVDAVIAVAERAEAARLETEASIAEGLSGLGMIRSQVEEIASRVRSLNEHIGQAGGITETVRELADQSHTLAVNASIEAARAGEQGKGFAVIAQNVRTLADQSIEATRQVQRILAELTAATEQTASFTGEGVARIEESLAGLRGSSERLGEMAGIINESANALRQIASAVRDQSPGVDAIADSVGAITAMMEEAMSRLDETNQAVRTLEKVSASVASAAGRFRT